MGLFEKLGINKEKKSIFPYNDGKDRAVYTCRHIMNKQEPIAYVSHDMNGDWTFLCKSCSQELDLNSVMIVALCDLYNVADISSYAALDENTQYEDDCITYKNDDEYERWLTDIKDRIAAVNVERNGKLRSDFSGIKIYRNPTDE